MPHARRARHLVRVLVGAGCAVVLFATSGCKKSKVDASSGEEATGESCAAKSEELRAWLRALEQDGSVTSDVSPGGGDGERYFDQAWPRPSLQLAHVKGIAPSPTPRAAMVHLTQATARFADVVGALDDQEGLSHVMDSATRSGLSWAGGFGSLGYFYVINPLVLVIDQEESWANVIKLVRAAAQHGFAQAYFLVAVDSHVASAPSSPVAKQMIRIAAHPTEMPYKRDVQTAQELTRQLPHCPNIARPIRAEANSNIEAEEQRKAFMESAANDYLACGCHADPDVIRAFAWTRLGRHWGPVTAAFELEIVSPKANEEAAKAGRHVVRLTASPTSPWREASRVVIDAATRPEKSAYAFE